VLRGPTPPPEAERVCLLSNGPPGSRREYSSCRKAGGVLKQGCLASTKAGRSQGCQHRRQNRRRWVVSVRSRARSQPRRTPWQPARFQPGVGPNRASNRASIARLMIAVVPQSNPWIAAVIADLVGSAGDGSQAGCGSDGGAASHPLSGPLGATAEFQASYITEFFDRREGHAMPCPCPPGWIHIASVLEWVWPIWRSPSGGEADEHAIGADPGDAGPHCQAPWRPAPGTLFEQSRCPQAWW